MGVLVKVVLFCGGYGMRMREGLDDIPKPMAMVGDRPLIWHVMRYYAHFGHTEFILCLGYGSRHITRYFLDYEETRSNDFVLESGQARLLSTDIADWKITFCNTGLDTSIGERLRQVADHLDEDPIFLANYADVLTDAPLNDMIHHLAVTDAVASLLAVPPQSSFHVVRNGPDGRVSRIQSVADLPLRENGGYFVFRRELLSHLQPGGDLVGDTLTALAADGKVTSYPYDGFWLPADTVKERASLDRMARAHPAPWEVWRKQAIDSSWCVHDGVGIHLPAVDVREG